MGDPCSGGRERMEQALVVSIPGPKLSIAEGNIH